MIELETERQKKNEIWENNDKANKKRLERKTKEWKQIDRTTEKESKEAKRM